MLLFCIYVGGCQLVSQLVMGKAGVYRLSTFTFALVLA
jgi:hypothetical protein